MSTDLITNKCKVAIFDRIWNNTAERMILARAICDDRGTLVDYIVQDINSSFEKETGFTRDMVLGIRILGIAPYGDPGWLQKCRQAIGLGRTSDHDRDDPNDIQVFLLNKDNKFVAVTLDITKRMLAELMLQDSERLFAVNPDLMCIADENAYFVKLNQAWETSLGYSLDELKKHNYLDFVHPEDILATVVAMSKLSESKQHIKFVNRYRKSDGTYRYLEWHTKHYQNLIYATARDITEQRKTEEALKESEEKYRLIAEYTSDVIWVWNVTRGIFTYVSPSIEDMTGYTVEEYMNLSLEEMIKPETVSIVNKRMKTSIEHFIRNPESFRSIHHQMQIVCKNGTIIWIEVSTEYRYNDRQEIEIYGVSRDISKRKSYEQQLKYLCYHDILTGLYNRRFLEEEMKRLDTARSLPITIIMADVDCLKLINDTFGHEKGDEFIFKAAKLIKSNCRPEDLVARYGGDEFVVFLPRTNAEEAAKIVQRIKDDCASQEINALGMNISFGIAEKTSADDSTDEIIRDAENDMYKAKTEERERSSEDIINIVVKALYQKEPYEEKHAKRVSALCRAAAEALGYNKKEVEKIALAGLIHDIGKAALNVDIMKKSHKLSEDEFKEMKKHAKIGHQVIGTAREMRDIGDAVLAHHERMDGKGYPKGIKRIDIPMAARIISIAEAYDTMTSQSLYRKPLSREEAITEIRKNKGTQFDPEIAEIFIQKVI